MTKIVDGDLGKVEGFVSGAIGKEVEDTQKLINAINEFIAGAKTQLTGPAWEKELGVLESFLPILQARQQLADAIISATSAANGVMGAYTGGKDYDDSELTALYEQRASIYNSINNLSEEEGTVPGLAGSYTGIIAGIEEQIAKLEKLVPTDVAAAGNYQNLDSSISSMASSFK